MAKREEAKLFISPLLLLVLFFLCSSLGPFSFSLSLPSFGPRSWNVKYFHLPFGITFFMFHLPTKFPKRRVWDVRSENIFARALIWCKQNVDINRCLLLRPVERILMDWVTFCSHSNIKKRVSLAIQSFNRFFLKGTKFYFFPIKNGGRYPLFMGFSYVRSSGNISIPNLIKLSRKSRLLYLLSQKPLSLSRGIRLNPGVETKGGCVPV